MLKQALAPVIDLVYPPRCPVCGDAIGEHGALCLACWNDLVIPGDPSCATCQRPLGNEELTPEAVCAACMTDPPKHDGISAGTLYNDASRKLVLAFKHGNRIALSKLLGRLMLARLPLLEGEWLVMPVPLHRRRLWQRGYNQSALLAGEIAKARGHELLVDGLVRSKPTPSLGGLGRGERAKVLSGAIAANPRHAERIKGAQILLVDDVMTSGATSDACLKALRKAGAARVRIACFARVLDEAL
ncbi:ComF family protein [Alteraurantiacibacter aquimixticola]|uniref:ComF family protein n=1 Tax=Alteraurantiacibacter aquimixticola TaxID=2489173 RepID=A0A4T3F1F2_9SPHN|nr:ComF family protein [Alteraurantiacibacter aquimixticola]TIX50105.1 ComF family protein [Alteraurantiacibacter aquimixticola]